tara:strand:+ start:52 stop:465 length:414 start_codon:yes stop_codon:yes gene_type:complete
MAKKNIATFLAPNQGLSIAGDRVYAYSGQYQISTSAQTILLFATGNKLIDAVIQVSGPLKFSDPSSGEKSNYQLSFNGVVVYLLGQRAANSGYTNPLSDSVRLIIPPRTTVKLEVDSSAATAGIYNSAIIAGQIVDK